MPQPLRTEAYINYLRIEGTKQTNVSNSTEILEMTRIRNSEVTTLRDKLASP
jgi:hypothetical protein